MQGKVKCNTTHLKKRGWAWIIKDIRAWMLILPTVIMFYLMVWRPTVMGGVWAFFKMKGYTPVEFIGVRNFIEVIQDTQFWPTLGNTIKYVFWSLVIGYIPPFIIAIILDELLHFKKGFRVLIYLPTLIPGVAAMLMWYFIYYPDQTGLLNMILSKFGIEPYIWLNDGRFTIMFIIIQMTWKSFGGAMLMYYAALQGVQADLYEAATIDGAGPFRRLWYITIPQMSGVLLLSLIRQIIAVFQILQEPMTLTGGGPNGASISLGYQLYRYGFVTGRTGHAMALGLIIFVILSFLTFFYMKMQKKIEGNL